VIDKINMHYHSNNYSKYFIKHSDSVESMCNSDSTPSSQHVHISDKVKESHLSMTVPA